MTGFLRLLPAWLLRPLPPLAWWVVKRLPPAISERFLKRLIASLFAEFSTVGAELDDETLEVLFDPAVEWMPPPDFPDHRKYHGHIGVREEMRDFMATWSTFRSEVRSVTLDREREIVFGVVRQVGRGRASGADTAFDEFHVWHIRRGRIRKVQMFKDERAAMAAASR